MLNRIDSIYKHESIAKIYSRILESPAGQDIFLSQLQSQITSETDSTFEGLHSVPLTFILDKESNGIGFHNLWNSVYQSVDSSCNLNYLINTYIPAYPSMSLSIYDPYERQLSNLNSLDNDFQIGIDLDFDFENASLYKNGLFAELRDLDLDPTNQVVILKENEGFWAVNPSNVNTSQDFFNTFGVYICDSVFSQLNLLNDNYTYSESTVTLPASSVISIGNNSITSPVVNLLYVNKLELYRTYNMTCNPTENRGPGEDPEDPDPEDPDPEDPDDDDEEDCDRDRWQNPNMVERITRIKAGNSAAAEILSGTDRCPGGWFNKVCTFKIFAFIPKYDGDISDPDGLFYGDVLSKNFSVQRRLIKNGDWIWTDLLTFGNYEYREGTMGHYFIYKAIQVNEIAGTEITVSANQKFSNSMTFTLGGELGGAEAEGEVERSVENSIGVTAKWTESDWEMGDEIVYYCDCQECNNWQGPNYSFGQMFFSVRECSSLAENCQPY